MVVVMDSSVPRRVARLQPVWRKCMTTTIRPVSTMVLIGLSETNTIGYYYPSGGSLSLCAEHLSQTMDKLRLQYGMQRFVVVAHSMGGLIARAFILRSLEAAPQSAIPLFVTLATPWSGHKSAESGVRYAPAVVRSWYDMAP